MPTTLFSATPDAGETDNANNTCRHVCALSGANLGQLRVTFQQTGVASTVMSINNASLGQAAHPGTPPSASDITGTFGSSTFGELKFSGSFAGPTGAGGTGISGFKTTTPSQQMQSDWLNSTATGSVVIVLDYSSTTSNAEGYQSAGAPTSCQFFRAVGGPPSYNNNGAVGTNVGTNLAGAVVLIETQAPTGGGPAPSVIGGLLGD